MSAEAVTRRPLKSSGSRRARVTRALGVVVVAGLLAGFLPPSFKVFAQQAPPPTTHPEPVPAPSQAVTQPPAQTPDAWRRAMLRAPLQKSGCFKSTYPSPVWEQIPCTPAPRRPYAGAGGSDYDFASSPSDPVIYPITFAAGSFPSVTGVTSESSVFPPSAGGTTVTDDFSLQLNTNHFATQTCPVGVKPPCQVWQQFVFTNAAGIAGGSVAFISYWIYGVPCPAGWTASGGACYWNTGGGVGLPAPLTIADLAQLTLVGSSSGAYDSVFISKGGTELLQATQPTVFNLHPYWRVVEFNVFGDGDGSEAVFNIGSTIVVKIGVEDGTTNTSGPYATSFTAESNNLPLVRPVCPLTGHNPPAHQFFVFSLPAIIFTESNAAGATSMCACPANMGWNPGSGTCILTIRRP